MFVCWSVKGGSGTTVVAAALAIVFSRSRPTLLVDLEGDASATLGLDEPRGPGLYDWLSSSVADAAALERLTVSASERLSGVAPGTPIDAPLDARWAELGAAMSSNNSAVVVDAGVGVPPPLPDATTLLVIRPCFLALRRATLAAVRPTGIVLVTEPGRSLGTDDVERSVGAPVVAKVPLDPAVARAVDAGLLRTRLPRSIAHAASLIAAMADRDCA